MPLVAPPGSTAVAVGSSICVLGGQYGDVFHYFSFRQPAEGWKEATRMLKKPLLPSVVAVDRNIYICFWGWKRSELFIPSSSGSGNGGDSGKEEEEEDEEFSGTWCPLEPPPKRERILVVFSPFVLHAYHLKYKSWE
ncbi:hypothetical protein Dimus_029955 [Dionaea muscipula]